MTNNITSNDFRTHPDPAVRYRALLDLHGFAPDHPLVRAAYTEMAQSEGVRALLREAEAWLVAAAWAQPFAVGLLATVRLADYGVGRDVPEIARLAERLAVVNGVYFCASPLLAYALARFGYADHEQVTGAVARLNTLHRLDGGWHPSPDYQPAEPNETAPSCPVGTLHAVSLLGALPTLRGGILARSAADHLLKRWSRGGAMTCALSGAHEDPSADTLALADGLAALPFIHEDARFAALQTHIREQLGSDGTWAGDAWRTLLAWRVLAR